MGYVSRYFEQFDSWWELVLIDANSYRPYLIVIAVDVDKFDLNDFINTLTSTISFLTTFLSMVSALKSRCL